MKIIFKATVITLLLTLVTLYASSEHKHETLQKWISNTAVKEIAIQEVKRLALAKKIPNSWKSMPVSKIGKVHYGDTNDWVVGFDNQKIKDSTKQTLYIFVSIHGKIMGANYTGN